jgi:tRNA pseudouridine38-40 synthase
MRTLKLVLEYDGFDYCGWQVQAEAPTLQGVLEAALAQILGARIRIHGAGRTDARVHALGQVASFRCPSAIPATALQHALNSLLPRDVVVLEVEEVPADFHARFSALGKVYSYRILNRRTRAPLRVRYAWHIPQVLDLSAMAEAALSLQGTHDFRSFQAAGSRVETSVRTIRELSVTSERDEVVMHCTGNGFLRHMVRNMVGTLVEVGRGRRSAADVRRILDGRDRHLAGATAPPQGLCLVHVIYPSPEHTSTDGAADWSSLFPDRPVG